MWDVDNVYPLYIVEDETPQNGNSNNSLLYFEFGNKAIEGYIEVIGLQGQKIFCKQIDGAFEQISVNPNQFLIIRIINTSNNTITTQKVMTK
jgi:hypothetical protein